MVVNDQEQATERRCKRLCLMLKLIMERNVGEVGLLGEATRDVAYLTTICTAYPNCHLAPAGHSRTLERSKSLREISKLAAWRLNDSRRRDELRQSSVRKAKWMGGWGQQITHELKLDQGVC